MIKIHINKEMRHLFVRDEKQQLKSRNNYKI